MAELPALPRPQYGRNEMMVLDNNVLVGEIVDAMADNQQMIPGFEEFMNTMQSISNSLNDISIGLSELGSRFTQMFDDVLIAEEIKPEQSDAGDKDKLFTTLETLVATSFLTLEALRALPNSFEGIIKKDQKAEEQFSKKDTLSLKEKELESSSKKSVAGSLVSSISKSTDGFLKNLLLLLTSLFIGFFAAGGSLSELLSSVFDFVVQQIKDLFSSLFTAIKDAFIGFVINPIISVLNTIPGVDIKPLMTTEEQARAAGQTTTGTEQIGSTFGERVTAKTLIKGASILGGGASLGISAYERAKSLFQTPEKKAAETLLGKEIAETTGKQTAKTVAKDVGKIGLKTALKKIPLLGLAFGGAFAAQRALEGDYTGAGLELASGAAGAIPGFGTAASLGIDALLAGTDVMGYTGAAAVQDRNLSTAPSAAQLKNNLDMARQTAEEVRSRPQQQMGGDVNSIVMGGTNINNARTEIIQPAPEAGTDMGIAKKVR
jgi:hypothetical protein